MKFKNLLYPVILAPAYIPELNSIEHTKNGKHVVLYWTCPLGPMGCVIRPGVNWSLYCRPLNNTFSIDIADIPIQF